MTDDWGNYEIVRTGSINGGQSLVTYSECDSTSHDTLSTSTAGGSDDNSGSRKRPRDNPSYENISPEDRIKLQKQYKLTRPRIVKRDFRRDFPMLWVNVTNTGSYDLMMEHINTFYHKDVVLRQRDLRPCTYSTYAQHNHALMVYMYPDQHLHAFSYHTYTCTVDVALPSPDDSKTANMSGIPVLSEFWYKAMNLAPDLVCKLKHSVLKVRSDGTSSIRCSFMLNGTKIVQLMSGQDLRNIQAYAEEVQQNCTTDAPVYNKPEISASVAAIAAVAPTKVRAALKAQQAITTLPTTDSKNIMHQATDKPDSASMNSSSKSAVLSSQLQALTTSTGATGGTKGSANLSVWDELADMDSTKTAERYIQAAQAASKCTKKKRTAKTPKPTKDWFTVVQDPQNVETSVMTMKKLSESQFHIPYTCLMTMCASDENYNSLRAENDAHMGTGMAFTAHTISQPGSSGEGTVVLTSTVDWLCSLELNFSAEDKVESMVLNYIT